MIRFFAGFLCFALLTPMAMAADGSVLLGEFKNWATFSTTVDGRQVCYALSEPRAKEPKTARRDPIYFLVNDWPSRHAKAESEIVPGYKYKDGAPVTVAIGPDKFTFFSRNDGNDGSAWIQVLADGPKLIDAMSHGVSVVVTGISARGTMTRDTYSLAGFEDAMAKIHATCGM
jgi:hypothetical protein